ncbi:MAG TPA: hypothetical protein VFZ53_07290 [Polyangiaceae bacterium]
MTRFSLVFVGAALALACGGSPKPAATPSGEPAPAATRPASTGERGASPVLRRHWTLGREVPFVLYVDAEGLSKTALFAAVAPFALSREDIVPAPLRECVKGLVEGAREIVAGGDGTRSLLVARLEPSALATAPGACLALAFPFEKATPAPGAVEAYTYENRLLVTTQELLLYGTSAEVTAALAGNAPDGAWPAGLELGPQQFVACRGTNGTDTSGSCSMNVAPELFRVDVLLELPDEQKAKQGVEMLKNVLVMTGANGPLRGFSYEQKGSRLELSLEARGSTLEQARELGTVSALVIHGVKKYVQNAKQAEARVNVARIARAVLAGEPKKLASYPAVPATIPRGMYKSAPAEWKAWEPLGFSLRGPQFYQYEIVAARDGKSAEVIARGDLDEDGRPSKFLLRVKVENGVATTEPRIEETEPDE